MMWFTWLIVAVSASLLTFALACLVGALIATPDDWEHEDVDGEVES